LIRLGHCLVTYDRTRVSTSIYPQAIQIFMSARVNNSLKLDEMQMNVSELLGAAFDVDFVNSKKLRSCQLVGSDLKFLEKTTFLINETQGNIGSIIYSTITNKYNNHYNPET